MQTITATFEDGVLKPSQPLDLPAHASRRKIIDRAMGVNRAVYDISIELPAPLADKNQYTADNNRIEALSMGPNQELLIAPEKPLLNGTGTVHEIYTASGKTWAYRRKKGSSIKAIEFLPSGDLLVLQREKAAEGGKIVSLLAIDLDACDASAHCDAVDLPVLSGRLPAANFEGLARIDANRFVMVADAKRHDPGPALLLLFRTESAARTRIGN